MKLSRQELHDFLEMAYRRYNTSNFIEDDPISIPHQFSRKEDIEIAGFLAATIAWGQRKTIIRNAQQLVDWMDQSPYEFICQHQAKDRLPFQQFVHRTFNGEDATYFLEALQHIYTQQGGLEAVFKTGLELNSGTALALNHFHDNFFSLEHSPQRTRKHVANPSKGSSAKRINMYLRWMVRQDPIGVDFGIWKSISPATLFLPLDVHTGNVGRKLGLLKRKQNDWKSVVEITEALRKFDPNDPIKYDFALFGLGAYEGF